MLPAVITPFDEAAASPPNDRPELNAVKGQTKDLDAAIILGEGTEEEMADSGAWIQMGCWTTIGKQERMH